jgi:hypothetical protein
MTMLLVLRVRLVLLVLLVLQCDFITTMAACMLSRHGRAMG